MLPLAFRLLFLAMLCTQSLIAAAAGAPTALDPLLTFEQPWQMDQDAFQAASKGLPFRWTSDQRESARAADTEMTLLGLPVVEAVARFQGGKLSEITAFFFARGDSDGLTPEKFGGLIQSSSDALNRHTKVAFAARGKDAKNAVKADGRVWQTEAASYVLEYSFTREVKSRGVPFRAEFIRLEVTPPAKAAKLLAPATTSGRTRFAGATHVKRDAASGDVLIADVPMVDQGQKGYCVVASAERVMRYYGNPVDANELAQIANSDAEGGTSLPAMLGALKKISARLRVRVRTIQENDLREILDLIKDYNRAAKKAGELEIADPGRMIDVGAVFRQMKPELLKEARLKSKAEFGKFQRSIQSEIEQGVPLLWTVMLGIIPERGIPQGAGGHMRLIIGFNTKTQELLYSDSWGAGHELKRMAIADAYAITTGIATIEPL